ncbi:major facilitator superfamily domain-containing protein, partial [Neohortaea acidophila]
RPTLHDRQSTTFHYHTFPTAPPRQRSDASRRTKSNDTQQPPESPSSPQSGSSSHSSNKGNGNETPLPKAQLLILAVIALAEQTALNSISPYLPEMTSTFPEVDQEKIGMYVGLIASSFALAQFATNFLWGWLSDKVGRKPVVLTCTFLTACCFVGFGFSRTLWQAVLAQVLMGLSNGNQGVVSTCLGEITDRSNQSRAFQYLPIIYGIGGITGPIVGGLLVKNPGDGYAYPFLLPNIFSAGVLILDMILSMIFLKESLECAQGLPPLGKRVSSVFARVWQFTSAHRPTYLRRSKKRQTDSEADTDSDNDNDSNSEAMESVPSLLPHNPQSELTRAKVFTRDTILLLATFLIFQLANIAYNSLYPIFAQAGPPNGRALSTEEIGISLAFAGLITILFQLGIFGRLREKVGNKVAYRTGLAGFVIAFLLMPWVGYKDGKSGKTKPTTMGQVWLWVELGSVLIIKTVASVGGLTSALLLITNSAPSHAVLGTLNGLAQTLSAAGRAVGPFISGSLFTAALNVQPKGEALAFGIFGAVSFIGFLLSFGIRGADLESGDWEEGEDGSGDEDESE